MREEQIVPVPEHTSENHSRLDCNISKKVSRCKRCLCSIDKIPLTLKEAKIVHSPVFSGLIENSP